MPPSEINPDRVTWFFSLPMPFPARTTGGEIPQEKSRGSSMDHLLALGGAAPRFVGCYGRMFRRGGTRGGSLGRQLGRRYVGLDAGNPLDRPRDPSEPAREVREVDQSQEQTRHPEGVVVCE